MQGFHAAMRPSALESCSMFIAPHRGEHHQVTQIKWLTSWKSVTFCNHRPNLLMQIWLHWLHCYFRMFAISEQGNDLGNYSPLWQQQATIFFFFTASCNVCLVKKNFFPSFSSLFRKTLLVCLFDAHNKRSGDFSLFSPRYFGIMETLHHSLGSSHLPWTVNEGLARVRFHLLCYLEPKSSCCCCCCFVFFKVQNFTQNSTCHIILPS